MGDLIDRNGASFSISRRLDALLLLEPNGGLAIVEVE